MAARIGLAERLFEKFFYDFSLYRKYFADKIDYNRYVLLRHNFMLVSGYFAITTLPFPYKPAFPTMGMCPKGYEGTFVSEPDRDKALQMYKDWKAGKKPEPAAAAPATH